MTQTSSNGFTDRSVPPTVAVRLTVNGQEQQLQLDPRVSLLDALREHLHLTGTKKGCDHGQCGLYGTCERYPDQFLPVVGCHPRR
ncbi:2Fe-2S iron-sulfur cluster-binding protein [Deinococcus radiophilus]|uniref:2Fe-2S iron-sulfur cluster-binding protein n=1 Tax=Deinococcus radiophilus TaxID=32062 RepID=UPI0036133B8B